MSATPSKRRARGAAPSLIIRTSAIFFNRVYYKRFQRGDLILSYGAQVSRGERKERLRAGPRCAWPGKLSQRDTPVSPLSRWARRGIHRGENESSRPTVLASLLPGATTPDRPSWGRDQSQTSDYTPGYPGGQRSPRETHAPG